MHYDNPKHREMMDLEGLKAWVRGTSTASAPRQLKTAVFWDNAMSLAAFCLSYRRKLAETTRTLGATQQTAPQRRSI
jgi:hypothetical protein